MARAAEPISVDPYDENHDTGGFILISSCALEMKIIPRRYVVEELFDDTTRGLTGLGRLHDTHAAFARSVSKPDR